MGWPFVWLDMSRTSEHDSRVPESVAVEIAWWVALFDAALAERERRLAVRGHRRVVPYAA
ncbi:hypothetical protein GCM10010123_18350 [Pilimelia anulata]|uniref:Uncharacterized protein n=2 Tax=Pilimelia anulata TaxID=53371 RepID=A0A8J3F9S4_9ACTN|nr:hypothetical protein GCM10010123_18350 [Pilimelia anulata]